MHRLLLTLVLAASLGIAAKADEPAYMQFVCADGSTMHIAAENLTMAIVEGTLHASNDTQTLTIAMDDLRTFAFTNESGLQALPTQKPTDATQVYNINGVRMADDCQKQLPAGVYILKNNAETVKIAVK